VGGGATFFTADSQFGDTRLLDIHLPQDNSSKQLQDLHAKNARQVRRAVSA
jgi:hypothetical protein